MIIGETGVGRDFRGEEMQIWCGTGRKLRQEQIEGVLIELGLTVDEDAEGLQAEIVGKRGVGEEFSQVGVEIL